MHFFLNGYTSNIKVTQCLPQSVPPIFLCLYCSCNEPKYCSMKVSQILSQAQGTSLDDSTCWGNVGRLTLTALAGVMLTLLFTFFHPTPVGCHQMKCSSVSAFSPHQALQHSQWGPFPIGQPVKTTQRGPSPFSSVGGEGVEEKLHLDS